jgi:hypothetical protein
MSKNVIVLVGHCGPDSSFLRMAVSSADRTAQVVMADDPAELNQALKTGAGLILFNRELGYGFDGQMGVDLIKHLRQTHPHVKTMLVSNYPDAQAAAVANGALPGFGKREIGSPRVPQLIRDALAAEAEAKAG